MKVSLFLNNTETTEIDTHSFPTRRSADRLRYERVARLGRGGMGVVDLARRADGTEVALKRITLHGSADEMARARQRISREAEVLTKLRHPNVVELLEVLDDGDDVTLVMP